MKYSHLFSWLILLSLTLCSLQVSAQDEKSEKVDFDQLLTDARSAIGQENFEEAASKLQEYTKSKKDNGEAWFHLGYALHMSNEIDEAIVAHKKASEFKDWQATALYNLGCAYSLKGDSKKSVEYLHEALDKRFIQFDMFDSDPDLKNVRKSDEFKQIVARVNNGGKRVKKEFDTKQMAGKWKITSGTRQGNKIGAERMPPEITVSEKEFTIPAGPDQKFVMSYKVVGTDKDIVHIDLEIESGPAPEGSAKAIFKLDGDKAKLCYDPTGQTRPEKFETTAENGFFSFEMEKIKPEFDAKKMVGKWDVTKGVRNGADVPDERLATNKIEFDKEKVTIPFGDDAFVMSYTLNKDKSPVQIDLKMVGGPAPAGSPAIGIVKFDGDKFYICYNPMGGERPKKFESKEGDNNHFFIMEMEK